MSMKATVTALTAKLDISPSLPSLLGRGLTLWTGPYLLKYSLILSFDTFSGRLPTQRCLVSRTIIHSGQPRPNHWNCLTWDTSLLSYMLHYHSFLCRRVVYHKGSGSLREVAAPR